MKKPVTVVACIVVIGFILTQSVSAQLFDKSKYYYTRDLRNDLRLADIAVFINVFELQIIGKSDESDCENNVGGGYCSYLLKAQVREVFKGKINKTSIEFQRNVRASLFKQNLLGEQIVFFVWKHDPKIDEDILTPIPNFTRGPETVETMQSIVNPKAPLSSETESEPYSLKGLEKDFERADAVIFSDVKSFMPFLDIKGKSPFLMKGEIKEVFKGDFSVNEEIEYREDFFYRPVRETDLGEQVTFLKRIEENDKIIYKRLDRTLSEIRYDMLEKLRYIAQSKTSVQSRFY